ncbi:Glutamate--tRNA ligase [Candidatus Hepatincola sp. Pdp]
MSIVTRFAPSPTGYLHLGGARTALFNYLYTKKMGGEFLLRIEDTDTERSTTESVATIINGLKWLAINPSKPPVFQMSFQNRHIEIANQLLKEGKAYKCYCTPEEIAERREKARKNNTVYLYDGRCAKLAPNAYPNKPYAIRLIAQKVGFTTVNDIVMGEISVPNSQMDDMVILRSNNIPTYMFAVVVDDYDMKITHVIRGSDHLTNTFRQIQVYKALGWKIPIFAHLPLIHAPDGSKLSKRHGAVAVESYKDLGFLPEALRNYLLRLGWSHNDDEIISDANAIQWFDIKDIHKSPAKFDLNKLTSINKHYLQKKSNKEIINLMEPFINNFLDSTAINPIYKKYLTKGLTSIKERSSTLVELTQNALFYITKEPMDLDSQALEIIEKSQDLLLQQFLLLQNCTTWQHHELYNLTKEFANKTNMKLGKVVEPMRICLTYSTVSPASNFEIMEILGKDETLLRINRFIKQK